MLNQGSSTPSLKTPLAKSHKKDYSIALFSVYSLHPLLTAQNETNNMHHSYSHNITRSILMRSTCHEVNLWSQLVKSTCHEVNLWSQLVMRSTCHEVNLSWGQLVMRSALARFICHEDHFTPRHMNFDVSESILVPSVHQYSWFAWQRTPEYADGTNTQKSPKIDLSQTVILHHFRTI